MSSSPDADDNLIFSMRDEVPSTETLISGMEDVIRHENIGKEMSTSLVKTHEKALLKSSAHSASEITSPESLVRVVEATAWGLIICQNLRGLLVNILGKSLLKKANLALRIPVR